MYVFLKTFYNFRSRIQGEEESQFNSWYLEKCYSRVKANTKVGEINQADLKTEIKCTHFYTTTK